ncbi:MAG: penicillin acylase family protein [Bryobacterales bacterium]|nr:penicillin acylase family protein [Bryobacterales bacterium]
MRVIAIAAALAACLGAQEYRLAGLNKPVEILRDKWGIPHIYAQTQQDLFFAQGWITAKDRLFQLDLWRRVGTGKLAEVLGPEALNRDRIARLVRFRGDWNAEWQSYSPDAKEIATAFTSGINAYIKSLDGKRPLEFRIAGFDPGLWAPEDVTARIAGLLMIRNIAREVQRAQDIERFGLDTVQKFLPPDPFVKIEIPHGLDLRGITATLLADYNDAIGTVRLRPQSPRAQVFEDPDPVLSIGSNNWVVSGAKSATGKPLLANDPHRPILIPSLRKTVHLVGPGWNAIGAGEPALPGIALGHNEEVGFGFTIVGIDQGDLYVEKLNPNNPDEYLYRGQWRKMEVVEEPIKVAGSAAARKMGLRYTMHGPVIAEDLGRHRAYALKWVGSEPGSAGYLPALRLARARNWDEFQSAATYYKIPSENLVYADRAGNIGWIAAGQAPIRKNWTGLLPVPGDTGEYEWSGFLPGSENPRKFNPAEGFIATANHKILPENYRHQLAYEWAAPFRFGRIDEVLKAKEKFSLEDLQQLQQDVLSLPARRFQKILKNWHPADGELSGAEREILNRILGWDTRLRTDSTEALIFEIWAGKLHGTVFGPALGTRAELGTVLLNLEQRPNPEALLRALRYAVTDLTNQYGSEIAEWKWGKLHTVTFRHPLDRKEFNVGPIARPGDGNTVNSTSGPAYRQTAGASYRQILDVGDWDRSVTTNVPGESGDPNSPFYSNLAKEWSEGRYHPLLYTRRAVEANTAERMQLVPAQ